MYLCHIRLFNYYQKVLLGFSKRKYIEFRIIVVICRSKLWFTKLSTFLRKTYEYRLFDLAFICNPRELNSPKYRHTTQHNIIQYIIMYTVYTLADCDAIMVD